MGDTYALLATNVGGLLGALSWLFWMLATGRLGTRRELDEKNKRIERLEEAVKERDHQIDAVLMEYLPAANSVMKALHQAAEGVREL